MIYELREYTAVPGKLPALVARFNEHTFRLFEKHGIDVVFISRTEIGDNSSGEVVYAVRFESHQEMADRWAAFLSDPEWQRVKRESEADGPLSSQIKRRVLDPSLFPGFDS